MPKPTWSQPTWPKISTAVAILTAAIVVPLAGTAVAAPATPATQVALAAPAPSPTPAASPQGTAMPCNTGPSSPTPPSNTPPTAPGTPELVSVLLNSVQLRWDASTDSDGIACYHVRELKADGTRTTISTFQPPVTEGTIYLPWPPTGVQSQTHTLYIVAVDTLGAESDPSGTVDVTIVNDRLDPGSPTPTPTLTPGLACHVDYNSWAWDGGMSVSITISNTGPTTIHGWLLTFAFPDPGQHITNGWSAQWSQSGTSITATPVAWNSDLAPGQHITIGFNGTNSGTDPEPPIFYLNGVPCD